MVFAFLGASELVEQAEQAREGEKAENSVPEELYQCLKRPIAGDSSRKLLVG